MIKSTLVAAAITGMMLGAASVASASPGAQQVGDEKKSDKNACKGKNSCKGKGGCKTDKNACKGKNECKGHGGCATDGSKK